MVQVSDVALAALILVAKEEPADYFFSRPEFEQDYSADSYRQMGFSDHAARRAAKDLWRRRHPR
jgi:hypothetical protein